VWVVLSCSMQSAEALLAAPAVVGPFDPGDGRDPQRLATAPVLAVQHVLVR
jgi:hypothetical protein